MIEGTGDGMSFSIIIHLDNMTTGHFTAYSSLFCYGNPKEEDLCKASRVNVSFCQFISLRLAKLLSL